MKNFCYQWIPAVFFVMFSLNQLSFAEVPVDTMPHDFVKLSDIAPEIIQSHRYYSRENFMGRIIPGYTQAQFYCTYEMAIHLRAVNLELQQKGYQLVVYDTYRPQRSVNAFFAWSQNQSDELKKAEYYPTIPKNQLFDLGYIAQKSGHSRGSTVDLTLIRLGQSLTPLNLQTRQLTNGEQIPFLDDHTVDMGSSFDLFHSVSHHDALFITPEQTKNRELLRQTMIRHGFKGIAEEWWHYTLVDEPYPDTYFDFIPE